MKRKINMMILAGLCLSAGSCWQENIPEAGASRHQVENLAGVAGDEEALLSWTMPEGWNPTDFIISYTGDDGTASIHTGGAMEWTVQNLVNEQSYVFSVQAVYGKLISGAVETIVKPATSRFPVTGLEAFGTDGAVELTWTRPALTVLSYTLTWVMEGETEISETTIGADAGTYKVSGLTNDKNYTFTMTANYGKGASDPVSVKAMPTLAIPYILDRTTAASGQPITFTFNEEGYPDATNVSWTFPNGDTVSGKEVKYGITSVGTQTVTLSADIRGKAKTWTLEVEIREYVVNFWDWTQSGTSYEGFKGSCPVFSPDGKTVYDVTFNKIAGLYAIDLMTGDLKWRYIPEVNSASYNPLTVNPVTGDIYYGTTSAGQFYAVSPDGELLWKFTGAQSMKSTAPAVNAAGTVVYIGDASGNVFALNTSDGSQIWKYAFGNSVAGLLVNGDDIVAGGSTYVIFLNASDGSLVKSLSMSSSMVGITGFAVAADKKTAYLPVSKGLTSVDLEKRELIVDNFAFAGNNPYEPVIAPDGNVFVGCKDCCVYNVKPDLSAVNWSYKHDKFSVTANAFNFSRPVVDSGNRFMITSGQSSNTTYIFSASGEVLDSWTYEESDKNQKQMAGNNFIDGILFYGFIGSSTRNGGLVGKYVGGERASGWSSHGGDICGSCCVK